MDDDDDRSDEELMAAYVAGSEAAFRQLSDRYTARLYGLFLRSFTSATASDLVQVTWLKLHRARDDYRTGAPLRPWLFSIAHRVRLDELRRMYRQPEEVGEEELDRLSDSPMNSDPGPSDRDDKIQVVQRALKRLPESQRMVIHLHRFEGMTFPEIAQVLKTTEGAVKLRAFRAYERLRKDKDLIELMTGEEE